MRRLLLTLLFVGAVAAPATAGFHLPGDRVEDKRVLLAGPVEPTVVTSRPVVIEPTTTAAPTTTTLAAVPTGSGFVGDTWEKVDAAFAECCRPGYWKKPNCWRNKASEGDLGEGWPLNQDCKERLRIQDRAYRLRHLEEGPGMPGKHTWPGEYMNDKCPRPGWPLLRPYWLPNSTKRMLEGNSVFPVKNPTRWPFIISATGAPQGAPWRVRVEPGATRTPPFSIHPGKSVRPGGGITLWVTYEIGNLHCSAGYYRLSMSDFASQNWWAARG